MNLAKKSLLLWVLTTFLVFAESDSDCKETSKFRKTKTSSYQKRNEERMDFQPNTQDDARNQVRQHKSNKSFSKKINSIVTIKNKPVVQKHKKITLELIQLVKEDLLLETALKESLKVAAQDNPDKQTNPIRDLKSYYKYIDNASELIPQNKICQPIDITKDNFYQAICYFFILSINR